MTKPSLQVTCHMCDRTGQATDISGILSQELPPAPQFVLVGPDEGFSGALALCTLCPIVPPAVTHIRGSGDPVPYTTMPDFLFVSLQVIQRALERIKEVGGTQLGRDYFLELVQQLPSREKP